MNMGKKLTVGVMGPGESATEAEKEIATTVGKLIAENGWILLSGGRSSGVMGAVCKGYKEANGVWSIGISPTGKDGMSPYVDYILPTNMHSGRNILNAQASDVIIAIGNLSSAGTLSEVAFGLIQSKPFDKTPVKNKPVYLLGDGNIVDGISNAYPMASKVTDPERIMELIRVFDRNI